MLDFYFKVWFSWLVRVVMESVVFAGVISVAITLVVFISKTNIQIDSKILKALSDIFLFWFSLALNLTLMIALFRSIKFLFNSCIKNYRYNLYACSGEYIKDVSYFDLIKVWREWLMLIVWSVAFLAIVGTIFFKLLFGLDFFKWFNIYVLYIFIAVSGFFSFIFLPIRCQRVRISRC